MCALILVFVGRVARLPRTGDGGMSFLPGVRQGVGFQLEVVHLKIKCGLGERSYY